MSGEERLKLYSDPTVQLLIDNMLTRKEAELKPSFDAVHGCWYPEVEKLVGSTKDVLSLLEKLASKGILVKKLFGKHIGCPDCGSPDVTTLLLCVHCRSYNILKKTLLEHLKCGYIGPDDHYVKEKGLTCPRCHLELKQAGVDFRKIGVWFECSDCKKRFEEPLSPQWCRSCGSRFSVRDSVLVDCYSYLLSEEAAVEARRRVSILTPIVSFLQSLQYRVEAPGVVQGSSGTTHRFDIYATKDGVKRLVLDVVQREAVVDEHSVIMMFAKIYDIGSCQAVMAALPRVGETASKLATQYNITVVEAEDADELVAKLRSLPFL